MDRIIALVDGSRYSESVCDHAAWVAREDNSTLVLLHVLGRRDGVGSNTDLSGSIGLGARSSLLEELSELDAQKARLANKRGRAILEDAKVRAEQAGVGSVTTSLRNGQLIETMSELESQTDLIVIGKRGVASDFDMEHLGSNLERVVRSTRKPVLVASREFKPLNRILVAFDGGVSAMKAIEHMAGSTCFKGLECVLMYVGQESSSQRRQLEGAATVLKEAGIRTDVKLVPGQPDSVIASAIENDGFDMLVMGAYGHSRIRNLIIGSTTTQMLAQCKVPVLLYR